jgi:hypothetical protein
LGQSINAITCRKSSQDTWDLLIELQSGDGLSVAVENSRVRKSAQAVV